MTRIGFVQFSPLRREPAANLVAVQVLLSGQRADLLVLPELANSGYLYATSQDLAPFAEPATGDGPFLGGMRALAKSTGALIVTGFAEQAGAALFNSAAAISAAGPELIYRKAHLFADEKSLFSPGDSPFSVLDWQGLRIGMMVCFDWIFPESARLLALAGAQVIAHPSNLVLPGLCQQAMVTRSIENRVFTVTGNRYGTEALPEKTLTFTGASQITSPRGELLAQAAATGARVTIVEIDPTDANEKWITPRNHLLTDRRTDLYGPLADLCE